MIWAISILTYSRRTRKRVRNIRRPSEFASKFDEICQTFLPSSYGRETIVAIFEVDLNIRFNLEHVLYANLSFLPVFYPFPKFQSQRILKTI